jgi:hypothetical protein
VNTSKSLANQSSIHNTVQTSRGWQRTRLFALTAAIALTCAFASMSNPAHAQNQPPASIGPMRSQAAQTPAPSPAMTPRYETAQPNQPLQMNRGPLMQMQTRHLPAGAYIVSFSDEVLRIYGCTRTALAANDATSAWACPYWRGMFVCEELRLQGDVHQCQKLPISAASLPPAQAANSNTGNDPCTQDPKSLACQMEQDSAMAGALSNALGDFGQQISDAADAACVIGNASPDMLPTNPESSVKPPVAQRRVCAGAVLTDLHCKVESLSADPKSPDLATCLQPGSAMCAAFHVPGLIKKCE